MPASGAADIRIVNEFAEQDRDAVAALVARANMYDGLDIRVDTEVSSGQSEYGPRQFVAHDGDRVVGFAALDGTAECEASGVVDPEYRRRGVGRALLAAVVAAYRAGGGRSLLLVAEDASLSGRAFVEAVGAQHRFSEHLMELDRATVPARTDAREIVLRAAAADDMPAVATVLSAAFGYDTAETQRRLEAAAHIGHRYFLGVLEGRPVGILRVSRHDGIDYIYAFGVLAELRGRGYGRQMLQAVIDEVMKDLDRRLRIEVETENRNALGLYLSVGFRVIATYGYYELRA